MTREKATTRKYDTKKLTNDVLIDEGKFNAYLGKQVKTSVGNTKSITKPPELTRCAVLKASSAVSIVAVVIMRFTHIG